MNSSRTTIAALLLAMAITARSADPPCPQDLVPGESPSLHDPWLRGANTAALTRHADAGMGVAALSMTKGKGGFTDYHASPDALSVDAAVEGLFRLSSRAVVYGAMSYTNFSGRDMAASAFIQSLPLASIPLTPARSRHLPFDIVEDSLTNTGTKHQDTYRLTGSMGIDIHKGFALGARLDYIAANYAKYKDLRHKNKLMDLDFTAGFYLPLTTHADTLARRPSLAIGANYLYHRTTESLQFSTYGKGDKVYNSLVAYANFMGHVEQFGSTGYTDKSREMPLVSDYNGLSLQCSFLAPLRHDRPDSPHAHLFFYSSFTYAHRRGYYGRKSPYTITYTAHESDIYQLQASLSALIARASRLTLDLGLSAENLRNDASTYRGLQNDQGATYYEYYTPVKTANKLWTDGIIALTADLGRLSPRPSAASSLIPVWTLRAGLSWHHREQTAYLYPYYRHQDISNREPFVSIARNILSPRRHKPATQAAGRTAKDAPAYWSLALHFSFLKGKGQPFEDLTFQTPSDKQEQPPTMDAYLWREYQWLTSAQYDLGGSVAYSFVMPVTGLSTFVRTSISHHKANETGPFSLGSDHTTATLSIGCRF